MEFRVRNPQLLLARLPVDHTRDPFPIQIRYGEKLGYEVRCCFRDVSCGVEVAGICPSYSILNFSLFLRIVDCRLGTIRRCDLDQMGGGSEGGPGGERKLDRESAKRLNEMMQMLRYNENVDLQVRET